MVSLSLLSSHTNHDYPSLQGQKKKVQVLVVYTWQFNLKKTLTLKSVYYFNLPKT